MTGRINYSVGLATTILRLRMIKDAKLPAPHPATAIKNMRSMAAEYAAFTSTLSSPDKVEMASMLSKTAFLTSEDMLGAWMVNCSRSWEAKMPPAIL